VLALRKEKRKFYKYTYDPRTGKCRLNKKPPQARPAL